ncbi:hypothetical protein VTK56DRAFT_1379 [Thermocarpiscus australiensis]
MLREAEKGRYLWLLLRDWTRLIGPSHDLRPSPSWYLVLSRSASRQQGLLVSTNTSQIARLLTVITHSLPTLTPTKRS